VDEFEFEHEYVRPEDCGRREMVRVRCRSRGRQIARERRAWDRKVEEAIAEEVQEAARRVIRESARLAFADIQRVVGWGEAPRRFGGGPPEMLGGQNW
jgi:hypothetical protein